LISYGWSGPGEGWLDALYPSFQWMQIRPREAPEVVQPDTPLPTVAPGSVATAEACFRQPDGWITCVLRASLEYGKYRDRGLPEVSQNAPDFVPPAPSEVAWVPPTDVVSSHPSEDLPENEVPLHGEGGWIAGAADLYDQYTNWQSTPIFNFGGPGAGVGAMPSTAPTVSGCPSCSASPCVCGTINGRPALVDPRTGKRCYRRRRRVMLTEGDFNTLLRIATLPNNANVRTALAKAIGRR